VARKINLDDSANFQKTTFNNSDLPSIAAFPRDGNSWRIDWFGDIAFPNRLLRRTQPSVLVHLSRVVDASFHENPAALLSADSTFVTKQRKVWVSVGTLPLLCIGDIWRDGQLELRPDYELEYFSDLVINVETVVLIKAGLNLEEKGFLLPRTEHPWHMQCTQSYCLMIDLPLHRQLIIPCIELARFYFGSSSNLLTKLFLPPLNRDALYVKSRFHKVTGQLTLELAPNISGASAADIGRLHMDPLAWRAAAHIGTSLLKGSVAGQGAYPQTYFPFEGQTNLVATGKWLSLGNEPRATFIVYGLRSCSHPFPFRSLRYEVKGRNSSSAAQQNMMSRGASAKHIRKSAPDSRNQKLLESDASNTLARRARPVWDKPRFPDLSRKTIWKNRTLSDSAKTITYAGMSTNSVRHAAIGDLASQRRIRSIDLQVLMSQDDFPVPEFLQETVDELKTLKGFKVELLTESDQDGWTIPIPAPANEDGEIDIDLFVVTEENGYRERRVAVFSVEQEFQCVSIVVIESIPIHVKLYLPSEGHTRDLWSTLRCATADFISKRAPKNENIAQALHTVFDKNGT
jgi:hypothetical protein